MAKSHLTWVRGLKPDLGKRLPRSIGSHLTWVRGLKLNFIASFTTSLSRTLRGCVG